MVLGHQWRNRSPRLCIGRNVQYGARYQRHHASGGNLLSAADPRSLSPFGNETTNSRNPYAANSLTPQLRDRPSSRTRATLCKMTFGRLDKLKSQETRPNGKADTRKTRRTQSRLRPPRRRRGRRHGPARLPSEVSGQGA